MDCPVVYFVDTLSSCIYMEFIEGLTLKQFFDFFEDGAESGLAPVGGKISAVEELFGCRKEEIMCKCLCVARFKNSCVCCRIKCLY